MSDMFGDFDPYLEMNLLKAEMIEHRETINKLVRANNEQARTLRDISEQFVKITEQNVVLFRMLGEIQANEVK